MNKPLYNIFFALFGLYLFVSLYQISALNKNNPENVSNFNQVFLNGDSDNSETLDNIKTDITNKLKNDDASLSEIIWESMIYVHINSLHKIDIEHKQYAFDTPYVLNRLFLVNSGESKEKPHLSCGPRASAMAAILSRFDIYSRLVQVYSDEFDEHAGHRLLEVYNTEEKTWEVWDPDYGVTYVDTKTKKPVNILTLVFSDRDKIIPVGISSKGWRETKTEKLKNKYFEAVLFETDRGMTNSVIMVNTSLFNVSKIYSSGLNFEDWARKYYRNPRIILLSGDGKAIQSD